MNFKKVIGLILICATTISITTACSIGGNSYKNKEGVYLNKKYNTSDMVMLNGTELNAENAFMDKVWYGIYTYQCYE